MVSTMYWQLNSMWAAPSWSSLEYRGKWKQLQYVVKKVYEPVIASAYSDDDDITIYFWVTSDVNKGKEYHTKFNPRERWKGCETLTLKN
jgi:beta-mannosidase